MWKEFKDFVLRGNVVDLAVAVVIGAAFSKIIDSMVNDIIMPVIGAISGGLDFSNHFTALSKNVTAGSLAEAKKQGAVLAWGNFLQVAVNFLIIAVVLFLVLKAMNTLMKKVQPPRIADAPVRPAQEIYLQEIRDLIAESVHGTPLPASQT